MDPRIGPGQPNSKPGLKAVGEAALRTAQTGRLARARGLRPRSRASHGERQPDVGSTGEWPVVEKRPLRRAPHVTTVRPCPLVSWQGGSRKSLYRACWPIRPVRRPLPLAMGACTQQFHWVAGSGRCTRGACQGNIRGRAAYVGSPRAWCMDPPHATRTSELF